MGPVYRCNASARSSGVRLWSPGRGTGLSVYRCARAPLGAGGAVPVYRCIGASARRSRPGARYRCEYASLGARGAVPVYRREAVFTTLFASTLCDTWIHLSLNTFCVSPNRSVRKQATCFFAVVGTEKACFCVILRGNELVFPRTVWRPRFKKYSHAIWMEGARHNFLAAPLVALHLCGWGGPVMASGPLLHLG